MITGGPNIHIKGYFCASSHQIIYIYMNIFSELSLFKATQLLIGKSSGTWTSTTGLMYFTHALGQEESTSGSLGNSNTSQVVHLIPQKK